MTTQTLSTACPECAAEVTFADAPIAGEVLACADCGVDLEVLEVTPLRLDVAPEVEEDWGE